MIFAARLSKMDGELDLEALKAAALASLKAKKSEEAKKRNTKCSANQLPDELEALRAAALLSKSGKQNSNNGSGDDAAAEPSSFTSSASKTDGQEVGVDSGEESEFSILEEIEQGNIIEDSEEGSDPTLTTTDNPATLEPREQPVPELLEDVLDIAEFDDDDIFAEEELLATECVKQSSQSQVLDRRKNSSNGMTSRTPSKDKPKRVSSPIHRRSHSPTLKRRHQILRGGSGGGPRSKVSADEQRVPVKTRRKPTAVERDATSPVPQEESSLTTEQQEAMLRRQKKFSKTKVDTSKKTVKLKKTKEEGNVKKRLGSEKSKTVAPKAQPEIVRDGDMEVLAVSPVKTKPAAPKAAKRKIMDRLGGYVKAEPAPEVAERKRRLVSIDNSVSAKAVAAEGSSTPSESNNDLDMMSSEFSDASSDVSLESTAEETASKSQQSTRNNPISKLSLHKRNIWSTRAADPHMFEETAIADSRGRQSNARGTLEDPKHRVGGRPIDRAEQRSPPRPSVYNDMRERLAHRRDRTGGDTRRRDNGDVPPPVKVTSRTSKVGHRSDARAPAELSLKTDTTGKSRKELELDERIRKIKEMNTKREQRQKEIEKEKLLYG